MPTHTPETLDQTDTIFSDFSTHIAPITINAAMMERFTTLLGAGQRHARERRLFSGSETFETRALMSGIPAEIRGIDASGNNVNIETDEQLLTRATAIALEGTDAQKSDFIIGLATMSMQKQEALLLGLEEALATKNSSLKNTSDALAALPAPGVLPWAADGMQWGASGNADLAGKVAKTGDYVRSVAVAPNQSTIAVADGKNIRMVDAATGSSLWTTNAHHDRLTIQAEFSADGTKLVTHGHDKGVTMLNAATGDVLWQMPVGQYIDHVIWSPDQTKVLVSDYWGRISTMNAATGELTVLASDPKIWHAEYAPDGSILVANAQKLERRNAEMQNVSQSFQAPFTLDKSATQPNGNLVAGTSMSDGKIVFWDKTSGNQVALVDTGDIRVWKSEFSPNGKILAAVTNSSGVIVYTVNGTTITKLKQLTNMGEITDAAFSADGSALTISTQTGLYLYKTSDAARTPIMAQESQERVTLRAEVDELTRQKTALQNLTTSVDDLLDLERATFTLPMGPFEPSEMDAEPLSEELLDQTVLAFLEDQRQESESIQSRTWEQLTFAQAGIMSMALSPESDRIAVARADGSVRFMVAATGEETGAPLSVGQVTHMTYGRDGMLFLASGSTVSVVDETGTIVKSVVTPCVIAGLQTLRDGSIVIISGADGSSATCVTCVGTDGTEIWRKDLPTTAMGISVTSDGRSITYSQPNGIVTEALRPGGESFQKSFSSEFGSASVYASTSVVTPYGGRLIYGLNVGGIATIHITDMQGRTVVRAHPFGRDQTITSVQSVGGNFFLVDIVCQSPQRRETKLLEIKMDVLEEKQSSTLQSWRTAPMAVSEDGKTVLTGGMDTVKAETLPHTVSDTEALLVGASRIGNAVLSDGRLDNAEGKQLINGQRADLLMMAEEQGDAYNFRYSGERVWEKFMAVNDGWHESNKETAMKANNWSSDYFFYARGQEYESFRTKIGAYDDAAGRMMEAGMNAILAEIKGGDLAAIMASLRSIPGDVRYGTALQKLSQIGICLPNETTVLEACRQILINCGTEYAEVQSLYRNRVSSAVERVDNGTNGGTGEASKPYRENPAFSRAAIRSAIHTLLHRTTSTLVADANYAFDSVVDGVRIQELADRVGERLHGAAHKDSTILKSGVKIFEEFVPDDGNTTYRNIDLKPYESQNIRFVLKEPMMVNAWVDMNEVGSIQGGITDQDKPNINLFLLSSELDKPYHSDKNGESGESISSVLPAGNYYLQVTDGTSYESLTTEERLALDLPSVPVHLSFKPRNTAKIEGKISLENKGAVMPVSMSVAEFDEQTGQRKESNDVKQLDPSKPVWVVVHGMNAGEFSGSINKLTQTLYENPEMKNMQIVTVDWRNAAKDLTNTGQDDVWTPAVGSWIAHRLLGLGFRPDQISGIAHSHGTYVLQKLGETLMAQRNGQTMRTLVALDAAGHAYSSLDRSDFNFSNVAMHSVAIDSSLGVGSDTLSETAHTSFKIRSSETINPIKEHSLATAALIDILSSGVALRSTAQKHFSISRLSTPYQGVVNHYENNQFSGKFEGWIDIGNVQTHDGPDGHWYTANSIGIEYKKKGSQESLAEYF